MKDPLREYTLEKALTGIKIEGIKYLCEYCESENILLDAYPELEKSKRLSDWRERAAQFLTLDEARNDKANKIMRMAYFFHYQQKAVPDLVSYVHKRCKDNVPSAEKMEACETHAEQAMLLAMHDYGSTEEYYCITMFQMPSRRYWTKRNDYLDEETDFEDYKDSIALLESDVKAYFVEQGRGYEAVSRVFEDDEQYYFALKLPDTPEHTLQWLEQKPDDLSYKPVMDVVFVFDKNGNGIDIHAEGVETQAALHRICAKTLFDKDVPERVEDNQFFCLETLLEYITQNKPIHVEYDSEIDIKHIIVKSLKLQERSHPFQEITLNTKAAKRHVEGDAAACGIMMLNLLKNFVSLDNNATTKTPIVKLQPVHAELYAVYYDSALNRDVAKPFKINSRGGGSLDYCKEDMAIKLYLETAGILKTQSKIIGQTEQAVA